MQLSHCLTSGARAHTLLVRTFNTQVSAALSPAMSSATSGAQSSILGLLRTAAQECSQLDVRPVDTEAVGGDGSEWTLPSDQYGRWVSPYGVIVRSGMEMSAALLPSAAPTWQHPIRLTPCPRGSLSRLVCVTADDSSLQAPEGLLMDVHAVGINFRDVLNCLGMYPGDPGEPGGDCSGVAVRVPAVQPSSGAVAPLLGSSVFGLAPGCLGTRCGTLLQLVAAKPPCLRHDEAASMPTVCMTSHIMLSHANHVKESSSVLVHAAAGCVGMAAAGMLTALGTAMCGTAGSSKKRILARSMHAQCVSNSRDTAFVQMGAILTHGAGPQAVLNSLTSAGILGASFACMGVNGRFA